MLTKLFLVFFIIYLRQCQVNSMENERDPEHQQSRRQKKEIHHKHTGSNLALYLNPGETMLDLNKIPNELNYEASFDIDIDEETSYSHQYGNPNDQNEAQKIFQSYSQQFAQPSYQKGLQDEGTSHSHQNNANPNYQNEPQNVITSNSQQNALPNHHNGAQGPTDEENAQILLFFANHGSGEELPEDIRNHSFIKADKKTNCYGCYHFEDENGNKRRFKTTVYKKCQECNLFFCKKCFQKKHNLDKLPKFNQPQPGSNHTFYYGDRSNRCSECRIAYNLKTYVSTRCKECNLQLCAVCFKNIHKLDQLPLIAVTKPPVINQPCFYCKTDMGSATEEDRLVLHTKRCTRIPRRELCKFGCYWEDCGFCTDKSDVIKQHLRTHTHFRPFKCDFEGCQAEFTQKSSCKTHKQKIHGVEQ